MGIIVKAGEHTQKEIIPSDNYVARCYRMVHIGTNYVEAFDKDVNKVRITWELPTETRVFNEDAGEQPFVIDKEYTLSMHEKSNLRKDLESWRGKSFTDVELQGFDITNLVGSYCMLNVIHNEAKNGNTYANVGSIAKVPKGMQKPPGYNKEVIFDYENHFDIEFIKTLPDFIRLPIESSQEYKVVTDKLEGAELDKKLTQAVSEDDEIEQNDDLPF